ncbi:MAG: hypothetical protein MJZ32_11935 [Bacteroidaceae bacterium]|nr:hypothetical protein [Bacteroidaceae bacterium]
MAKKYDIPNDEPQMVSEPVVAYGYSATQQHLPLNTVAEMSNSEKKEFLRANLHDATAKFLESVDWMENKPYPMYPDSDDDSWIDAAEAVNYADIVDDAIVNKDRQAWLSFAKLDIGMMRMRFTS